MQVSGDYWDAPLVLAQHQLAKASELIDKLREEADPEVAFRPESPVSARRDALRELVPRWHFAMLNDRERNRLFESAIQDAVQPGDHVLDIGSGSGLLAMIAARQGAAKVTSCEFVAPVAQAAKHIIAKNGLSDVIDVVNKRSDELVVNRPPEALIDSDDMSERADVIVTEIVDCGLVGEGIMPTLRHAREHLLKPGGIIIPQTARVMAAPIESVEIWQLNQVDDACGFDVSHFNELATSRYFQVRLAYWPYRSLAEPREVLAFDFLNDSLEPGEEVAAIPIETGGTCHGIAFWFELGLDEVRVVSNEPDGPLSHWLQAFQCFIEPVELAANSMLRLKVLHNDEIVYFEPQRNTCRSFRKGEAPAL